MKKYEPVDIDELNDLRFDDNNYISWLCNDIYKLVIDEFKDDILIHNGKKSPNDIYDYIRCNSFDPLDKKECNDVYKLKYPSDKYDKNEHIIDLSKNYFKFFMKHAQRGIYDRISFRILVIYSVEEKKIFIFSKQKYQKIMHEIKREIKDKIKEYEFEYNEDKYNKIGYDTKDILFDIIYEMNKNIIVVEGDCSIQRVYS